jgi:hypothetical protein
MEKQNKYFRLFLKNQNINFEDIDDIVIVNEQKKCNNCNKMVQKNLKSCNHCGEDDFSQI